MVCGKIFPVLAMKLNYCIITRNKKNSLVSVSLVFEYLLYEVIQTE